MVHNGVEYGLMVAYAEGLVILHRAGVGAETRAVDAETAPLADPPFYRYDIDTAEVAELWRRGSVVGSWLLDLTAAALLEDPGLAGFSGRVADSGEGRWTVMAAVEEGFPPMCSAPPCSSGSAQGGAADFADRVLSATRKQFGGYLEKGEG